MSVKGILNEFLHIFNGKQYNLHKFSDKEREESVKVRSLKKEIISMAETVDRLTESNKQLNKQLASTVQQNMEGKIFDTISGVLLNGTPPPTEPQTPALIQKTDFSDEQLTALIPQDKEKIRRALALLGDEGLTKEIRNKFPSMSDASVQRGLELAKQSLETPEVEIHE